MAGVDTQDPVVMHPFAAKHSSTLIQVRDVYELWFCRSCTAQPWQIRLKSQAIIWVFGTEVEARQAWDRGNTAIRRQIRQEMDAKTTYVQGLP